MKKAVVRALEESARIKRIVAAELADEIEKVARLLVGVFRSGGKVVLFGNGGSAADAQHIAAELLGRFRMERPSLPALALTTNTSVLTALGNDYGHGCIFRKQVEAMVHPGDIVIAMSTSGNSPNVIQGIEAAKLKGAKTIGLCGKSGGQLADLVDYAIMVPSEDTPRIQEAHMTIGHIVCELVERELFEVSSSRAQKNASAGQQEQAETSMYFLDQG
jgi:D-sedoheptulose 7-phosphate isomerase